MPTAAANQDEEDRPLRAEERRTLAFLGLPTLGMALALTTVSTYLSRVVEGFTSSTVLIGLILGAQGIFAVAIPIFVGTWSDRLRTSIGGRLPFLLAGTPVMAVALVLMGVLQSLFALAAAAFVFFVGYFMAYEPYRALYPDLIDEEIQGRAQSTQALWRGAGTGLALVGGGLLLAAARVAPFAAAALALLICVGVFAHVLLRRHGVSDERGGDSEPARERAGRLLALLRTHPQLRAFLIANALWELAMGALTTFVVLYITIGLGKSLTLAVAAIGFAAAVILVASPLAGKLGDRYGRARVVNVALVIYGCGLLVPLVTQSEVVILAIIPVVAFGGAVIMTLPYALLVPMMPEREHGALTGFFSLSRGLGLMLGPALAGVAIQLLRGPLGDTEGYAAMWGVCAAAIFASIPLLVRLRRLGADDADRPGS
jgi:MFS family permease